jgi:hypothetical protein
VQQQEQAPGSTGSSAVIGFYYRIAAYRRQSTHSTGSAVGAGAGLVLSMQPELLLR